MTKRRRSRRFSSRSVTSRTTRMRSHANFPRSTFIGDTCFHAKVQRADQAEPLVVIPPADLRLSYLSANGDQRVVVEPTELLHEVELTQELLRFGWGMPFRCWQNRPGLMAEYRWPWKMGDSVEVTRRRAWIGGHHPSPGSKWSQEPNYRASLGFHLHASKK